jgi:putative PIN family toxin of toxin-antitoxin system
MRIVADTNTVLSGLLWQGPPRRLLDLARERTASLCTSLTLVAELAEVIARDKFAERVRAAGLSAAGIARQEDCFTR